MKNYPLYWFAIETGLLYSANYQYSVEHNIITDKYRIVFTGTKNWNNKVRKVRYYSTKPEDKNICLTSRSI